MQQIFRDLETLRRAGPGMDPVGYQMREKQLVQVVLENVEKVFFFFFFFFLFCFVLFCFVLFCFLFFSSKRLKFNKTN